MDKYIEEKKTILENKQTYLNDHRSVIINHYCPFKSWTVVQMD